MDALIGTTIDGRYRIVEHLGRDVYRGVQLSVERPVAIKIVRDSLDRAAIKRFLRDARLLAGFDHPNIASVIEFGQAGAGTLFVVMELLRGKTLADELARTGPFTARRACEVGRQVLDALAAAHARGIAHRDLRPENVVLLDVPARDVVKVRNFALAKRDGDADDLPFYLAPEAIAGSGDPAVDIYAFGCILYELVTGAPPFVARPRDHAPGATTNSILARHLVQDAPRLPDEVPAQLQPLLDALLAKTPERRPSAEHARGWLTALLDTAAAHEEPDQAATMLIPRHAIELPSRSLALRARAIMLPRLATAAASRAFSVFSIVPIVFALAVLAGSWWLYTHHGGTPAALLHAR